jgi:hypothetical protein
MTRGPTRRRARPARRAWLGLLLLLLAAWPVAGGAQVRPDTVRPDTILPDTVRPDTVPRDTVPRDTVAPDSARIPVPAAGVEPDTLPNDSAAAPPLPVTVPDFPRVSPARPPGFAVRRWEWDREALQRYHSLSVLDLLAEVPGLTIIRAGDFGSPAGLSAPGLGGGRLRVFLDGFELDPLGRATPDLQRYPLTDLDGVRVERAPGEVRVELFTYRVATPQPYSVVEAAGGTYRAKALHGLLSRGIGGRSVFTGSYDITTTEGFAFRAPFGVTARRVEWAYALSPRTSLLAEFRSDAVSRGTAAYPLAAGERMFLVRGRSELRPGLTLEAALGQRRRSPDAGDTLTVTLSSTQALLRAALETGRGWGEAGVRGRTAAEEAVAAPPAEAYASAGLALLPWLTATGDARWSSWGGAGGLTWGAGARAGGVTGPALFASLSGGTRALPLVSDSTTYIRPPVLAPRQAVDTVVAPVYAAASTGVGELRLGAEWVGGGAEVGLAAVALGGGTVVPFGLGFDPLLDAVAVDAARGLEARAVLPITRGGALRLDGWYSYWPERGGRPYLPEQQGRAALTLHGLFYDGQLEPTFRVELEQRGRTLAPVAGSADLAETSPYSLVNFFMQIRILDVRAFFRSDNLFNYRLAQDLPQQYLPGFRMLWGVRWVFRG